ncbi:MAG: hypothetical protein M1828_000031 [Chrysothrix sp. TS-e1954]|nr:MAG: hypothetical protein M1828_000031 [Chrysothrix sp. TS-e1954]
MRLFSTTPQRSEPRRRRHDYDRERKQKAPESVNEDRRRRSQQQFRRSVRHSPDRQESLTAPSSSSSSRSIAGRDETMSLTGLERRASADAIAKAKPESLPYPSFSKAHSREAVGKLDTAASGPYTPDATDIGKLRPSGSVSPFTPNLRRTSGQPPPSPPLTNAEFECAKHSGSREKLRKAEEPRQSFYEKNASQSSRNLYHSGQDFSASKSSLRQAEEGVKDYMPGTRSFHGSKTNLASDQGQIRASKPNVEGSSAASSPRRAHGRNSPAVPNTKSGVLTNNTAPVANPRPKMNSSRSAHASQNAEMQPNPKESLPTCGTTFHPPVRPKSTPGFSPIEVFTTVEQASAGLAAPPPPPPPPPPPLDTSCSRAPKVDYLLQNGGLDNAVSRSFTAAANPPQLQVYQQYMSPQLQQPRHAAIEGTFGPYQNLLDNFSTVLAKDGSVAVATGYRSVARRLLDRLETVFARNISSELCTCAMCKAMPEASSPVEEATGVSWGEVLELVSGRRELPQWPPFSLASARSGLGISSLEQQAPMQKLDVDVPEEYRDHYVRQSKKTKQVVQDWLANQPENQASPPQEVDDETLSFAMLTYLDPEKRRFFTALIRGAATAQELRSPTPSQSEPKSEAMQKIGLALQRLYRLPKIPREPECAMFLLQNPALHNALATLSAISQGEWEILISGRFDGFLWSGAEDQQGTISPLSPTEPSNQSDQPPRSATPRTNGQATVIGQRRKGTPAGRPTPGAGSSSTSSMPGPVQVDEETEIAVLAEVEREIYLGMEALEDAFETLHLKAESVRRALRERSAGLALAAKNRRGGYADEIEARLGTPAIGANGHADLARHPTDEDDGIGDERSELAPDDSASNAGFKERERRGRRKRRLGGKKERKTEMVLEEDEGSDVGKRR